MKDVLKDLEVQSKNKGVTYLSGWWIDWSRGKAYKPLNDFQWEEFDKNTGKSLILSEFDLPYYVKDVVAPGRNDKE